MIRLVNKLEVLKEYINTGKPILIYFSAKNCSVCEVLKAKIVNNIEKNFPKFEILEVKSDEHTNISSYFNIFSNPAILVYFDKKEFKRYGRNMSVHLFTEEIKRPYTLMCEDI